MLCCISLFSMCVECCVGLGRSELPPATPVPRGNTIVLSRREYVQWMTMPIIILQKIEKRGRTFRGRLSSDGWGVCMPSARSDETVYSTRNGVSHRLTILAREAFLPVPPPPIWKTIDKNNNIVLLKTNNYLNDVYNNELPSQCNRGRRTRVRVIPFGFLCINFVCLATHRNYDTIE